MKSIVIAICIMGASTDIKILFDMYNGSNQCKTYECTLN